MLKKLKQQMDTHINYPMAIAGALILGGMVFYINASHGWLWALTAASKQAAYTFFAGGFIARFAENLAVRWVSKLWSMLASVLLPMTLAVGLTFLVHSLKGTPEPWNSTLPTLVLSPIGFFLIGWRRREQIKD